MLFRDRREAGQVLARKLTAYAGLPGVRVVAVPRGGVPVAYEVARALQAPLEVFAATPPSSEKEPTAPGTVGQADRPERAITILVDDGLTSGVTVRAVVTALKGRAGRVVLAVPITTPAAYEELAATADEVVCARTPEPSRAVGLWYQDFSPTTAAEVRELLQRAALRPALPSRSGP